jgi:hypothetical protein
METLSEYLVRHRKSLKHFSALHGDYLQQKRVIEMEHVHIQHPQTDAEKNAALEARIAALEAAVAALQGGK